MNRARKFSFVHYVLILTVLAVFHLGAAAAFAKIGYDDCSRSPETTTCGPYVTSHIHDMGAIFPPDTQVKARYQPGWSPTCSGTAEIYISLDKAAWTLIATHAFPSGHGIYSKVATAIHDFRYVKVTVPSCYADWSSAAIYAKATGTYMPTQTLDFGNSLESGTTITVRGTPGFTHGCSGTATIQASNNGTSWTTVGTIDYFSYRKPDTSWRDYKRTVSPDFSFQYIQVTHSNCYNDSTSVEVTPYGYREYYAVIIGGQTGGVRHTEPFYTWYWNVTSDMYDVLVTDYNYITGHVYFLFEEDGSGDVDKDTENIHDRDSTKANVQEVFAHLQNRVDSNDMVYVFWVSHGSTTHFALPGDDFAHTDLDASLDPLWGKKVLALQPCYSGCAIDDISSTNRIIATSVSCGEVNSSPWAETWVDALRGAASQDSMGNISIANAFEYTAAAIQNGSEHPLLDDNGDGTGHRYDEAGYDTENTSRDGYRAARNNLGHLIPAGAGAGN